MIAFFTVFAHSVQSFLNQISCVVQPPFDGPRTFSEDFADLAAALSLKIVQDDGFSVIFRQHCNFPVKAVFCFQAEIRLLRILRGNEKRIQIGCRSVLFCPQPFEKNMIGYAPYERTQIFNLFLCVYGFPYLERDL